MLKVTRQPLTPEQRKLLSQSESKGLKRLVARFLWGSPVFEWWAESLVRDLTRGTAELLEVEVVRLAVGEERDDEGPLLFCDAGENRVLCLAGQWLCDPHVVIGEFELESDDAWFRSFTLTRAAESGLVFELRPQEPTQLLSERRISAERISFFGPSAIIPGTLDSLEMSLKNYSAGRLSHGAVS